MIEFKNLIMHLNLVIKEPSLLVVDFSSSKSSKRSLYTHFSCCRCELANLIQRPMNYLLPGGQLMRKLNHENCFGRPPGAWILLAVG